MKHLEKIIINIGISFIIIPIIIFCAGYLNWYIALPTIILFIFFWYKYSQTFNFKKQLQINKFSLIIILTILFIWIYFSGIGSFSYQNIDFETRNAIFNDLINYQWPLKTETFALSYYFTYWLPASLIGKIFGNNIANYFLLLYTFAEILIITYLIKKFTKKKLLIVIIIFIFFSGLDIIGNFFVYNPIQLGEHIEHWNFQKQYSSMTTCLYWVFNQAIPTWLICSLFLNQKNNKYSISLCSLAFAYSPWATIGFIPIVLTSIISKKDNIFKNLNLINIFIPITMLLIYGSFYLSISSSTPHGFIQFKSIIDIIMFITFIILEVLLFIIPTFPLFKKEKIYICICISLILIPLYKATPANDFCMRVSLPALFILMCYVIKALDLKQYKANTITLIIILIIGSITPIQEIYRSIHNTFTEQQYLRTEKSILYPSTQTYKELAETQFYVYNYEKTFFFKYLAKK